MTISDKNMNYKIIDKQTYTGVECSGIFRKVVNVPLLWRQELMWQHWKSFRKILVRSFILIFCIYSQRYLIPERITEWGIFGRPKKLICYDQINPAQYIFHEDTETCTPVYTVYNVDYHVFYKDCAEDIRKAKETREYLLDMANHPNWFDASYISWLSYDSLNIELPDGHLFLHRLSTGEGIMKKTDSF